MFRPLIILKKYLFTKPKWRILRIYTKEIKRTKIEELVLLIEQDQKETSDLYHKEYLRGKLEILNMILK